jgi:hypothetical protein
MNMEDIGVENNIFEKEAIELVQAIVNLIAENNFSEMSEKTLINESWCGTSGSQLDGFKKFEKWITGQLAMWEEDEGVPFRVDLFSIDKLDLGDLSNGVSKSSYQPTSYGEDLDFWFEFVIYERDDNHLQIEFNVNM